MTKWPQPRGSVRFRVSLSLRFHHSRSRGHIEAFGLTWNIPWEGFADWLNRVKPQAGIAGDGWKYGVKAFLEQENAKMGGRVQWSYERHLVGGNRDGRTVHNRLDLTWNPNAAPVQALVMATPIAQSMERGGGIADELAKLNDLKERGLLSAAEFEAAKARLLYA